MKLLTVAELAMQKTEQEWYDFITQKDAVQTREQTAAELGCNKRTLRKIAELMGIKYKVGRRTKPIQFKKV